MEYITILDWDRVGDDENEDWLVTGVDDDGEPYDSPAMVRIPAKYEVCPQCRGRGTSSAYLGAFTSADWQEQGEEFQRDYMAGHYDRQCETCKGQRVILVPDEDRATHEQMVLYYKSQDREAEDAPCGICGAYYGEHAWEVHTAEIRRY